MRRRGRLCLGFGVGLCGWGLRRGGLLFGSGLGCLGLGGSGLARLLLGLVAGWLPWLGIVLLVGFLPGRIRRLCSPCLPGRALPLVVVGMRGRRRCPGVDSCSRLGRSAGPVGLVWFGLLRGR